MTKNKWFLNGGCGSGRTFRLLCETYENKIAELEEENKELKTKKIPQLEKKIASIRGAHSVDCKKLNARTEQVERLKEVNAELKEVIDNDVDKKIYVQLAKKAKLADVQKVQLAKAKDLFLKFIDLKNKPCASGHSINMLLYENICAEAEQFLKEVSE
jgi:hypothetical protein